MRNLRNLILAIGINLALINLISCDKQEASEKPHPPPPQRSASDPPKTDGTAEIKMNAAIVIPLSDPTISFDKDEFDFGSVVMGAQLTHTFRFCNTGSEDLVIARVRHT